MTHEIPLYITGFCRLTDVQAKTDRDLIGENTENYPVDEWLKMLFRYTGLNYPKFHKMDLLCKSAFLATEFMLRHHPLAGSATPLIFANRTGSMVSDKKHVTILQDSGTSVASPATFVYTLPNIAMGEISIRHQLHSKNVFFIFEQFGDKNWIDYIRICFQDRQVSQVMAAWLEVSEEKIDILTFLVEKNEKGAPFLYSELQKLYYN